MACSTASHYLDQCRCILLWTARDQILWSMNQQFSFKKTNYQISAAKYSPNILCAPNWVQSGLYMLCMYHEHLQCIPHEHASVVLFCSGHFILRRAGLLLLQQDFEWRWSVPLFQCLTVSEFSFILFDLCLLITFFNFIMNYVPIVTFWIFTYHKIWILSIMFCFIWSYWIIYFLACL